MAALSSVLSPPLCAEAAGTDRLSFPHAARKRPVLAFGNNNVGSPTGCQIVPVDPSLVHPSHPGSELRTRKVYI